MTDCVDVQELVKRANANDSIAQNLLGAILATGDCVERDNQGALYWYLRAVRGGYVHAKWNAGSMLVDGEENLPIHRELGMRLIVEAAMANENSACLFVAQCYRNGSYGKARDEERARYWEARAWDHANALEYDRPFDAFKELHMDLVRPDIKFKPED